jgi:hypothetical protein
MHPRISALLSQCIHELEPYSTDAQQITRILMERIRRIDASCNLYFFGIAARHQFLCICTWHGHDYEEMK